MLRKLFQTAIMLAPAMASAEQACAVMMRLAAALCLMAGPALSGGLDLGADVAFDPCAEPLPSRESYLATVIGQDAEAVYAMQLQYHAWLCDGAGPAIIAAPPVIQTAEASDEDKLRWVFPGDNHGPGPRPSPVPLPATALLLGLAMAALLLTKPKQPKENL